MIFHTCGDIIIIKPIVTGHNGVRMMVSYEVKEEKIGKEVIKAYKTLFYK